MSLSRSLVVGMLSVATITVGAGVVCGQDYPNKPLRIITSPAGGGGDFTARLIAQGISDALGQAVVVDNRAGGAPVFGEVVAKSPPDGYTLLVAGNGLWIGPLLRKAPYDVVTDFAPITIATRDILIFVVHPSVPAKSVKDLIALAKARPGQLNYASGGIGGAAHLPAELFNSMAGVNIVHIPYKGLALAITALIGGEVQLLILDAGLAMPHIRSGKLRALAVTSANPSVLAPGLPTVAASGLPGYDASAVTAMFAPAKTPATIINRLNQEIVRFLHTTDAKNKFLAAGVETVASSTEELAAMLKFDIATTSKLIKEAGIKVD